MQEYRGCKYLDFDEMKVNGCPTIISLWTKEPDYESPRFPVVLVYVYIDGEPIIPINTQISTLDITSIEQYEKLCKDTIDQYLKDYEEAQK